MNQQACKCVSSSLLTRKISHLKSMLIQKTFQSRVKWYYPFCVIFFCSRDIQVFLLCKFSHWWHHRLCKCSSLVVWHKIKNISANNEAMLCYATWQGCFTLQNIPDGTHLDVATATCSVSVSCLLKIKYYHLWLSKAKCLALSKTYASPTFIGSPLKHF